jgi:hypothetical protein
MALLTKVAGHEIMDLQLRFREVIMTIQATNKKAADILESLSSDYFDLCDRASIQPFFSAGVVDSAIRGLTQKVDLGRDETKPVSKNHAGIKSIHLSDQCMAGDVLLIELEDGRAIGINEECVVVYKSLASFVSEDTDKDADGNFIATDSIYLG